MKKIVMTLAAALLTLTAVSAKPKMYLDGGITVPVAGNLNCDKGVKSEIKSSIGTDVTFRAMFTDIIGIYAQAGFFWPMQMVSDTDDFGELKLKASDFDQWWGYNMLIAPAIMPVHTEKFGLTIAPGLAIATEYREREEEFIPGIKQTGKSSDFIIGIGCNVGFDIHIAKNMYIKPSVETTVYFYSWNESKIGSEKDTNNDSIATFNFKPAVAFGFML